MREQDKTTTMLIWLAAALVVTTAVLGVALVLMTYQNMAPAPGNSGMDEYMLSRFKDASNAFRAQADRILSIARLVIASLVSSAAMLLGFVYGRYRVDRHT